MYLIASRVLRDTEVVAGGVFCEIQHSLSRTVVLGGAFVLGVFSSPRRFCLRTEAPTLGQELPLHRNPFPRIFSLAEPRGGHSHRCRSHSCDRGQEAVKGSRAVFGVSQVVKDNF